MTSTISQLFLADPIEFVVDISAADLNQAWEQSQCSSTPSSCWNAYLNRLCLKILPYLQQEYELEVKLEHKEASLPSYWEFVNGTAFKIGEKKLVLIPTEAIHTSELRVYQEWVDITGWVADYYLAVQVNLDEGCLWIWGYTTHEQLKSRGNYEPSERIYFIAEGELVRNIEILSTVFELCPNEPTCAPVVPLSNLPLRQAKNLLQRLGNSEIKTPRLEVPFEMWGALLENEGWRKNLYELRLGRQQDWCILQWFFSGISNVAQQSGWRRIEVVPSLEAVGHGSGKSGRDIQDETHSNPTSVVICRQLIIYKQEYIFQVIPVDLEERVWRFELRNASPEGLIPAGFKLKLLDEKLEPFENAEDMTDSPVEELYIEFKLDPDEGIVWQTEPIAENYDVEILRF
jgi:Protein of unknown function (DUF1822)